MINHYIKQLRFFRVFSIPSLLLFILLQPLANADITSLRGTGLTINRTLGTSAVMTSWKKVRFKLKSTKVRTPTEDQKLYGFAPVNDHVLLKFNKGYASPNVITKNQLMTIYNDYTLSIPPSFDDQVDITYEWVLKKEDQVLNKSQPVVQPKSSGGHLATQQIRIPENAEPGRYLFEIKLSSGKSYDVNQIDFIVE